ncbi:prostaglandin E2 receptor EP1 subtype-like [Huso huso]|uniref:Thromboxane A2 receptor n=1 Tax=Huso huso TaxID=61971 RepID=A0ABR0Y8W0_HUSHU
MSSPTLEPIFSTPTPTSDSPSISPPDPAFNSSLPPSSLSIAVPIFTMTLGAVSNILALGILLRSYSRYRRRTKATFLFLASNLVLTDFAGHVIPGAFALRLYAARMQWDSIDRSGVLCQLFGGCMVFFGLCQLFLGGAMAVERCVGLTRPLLHSSVVTSGHGRLAVALLCSLALLVAALPVLNVGRYSRQFPQTWCFLQVHGPLTGAELGLTLVFSGLGLASLAVSLLCNSLSGLALLQARMVKPKACSGTSLDIEMMVQLLGVTLVSCVCWSPFLISVALSVSQSLSSSQYDVRHYEWLMFLGVRLASWNQILDPWVYILLRRAVLRKIYQIVMRQGDLKGSKLGRWEASSFQSCEGRVMKRV